MSELPGNATKIEAMSFIELAERYLALEAKLEAMERAGRVLLDCLPDSIYDDESWGWCWDELSDDAQDLVKDARQKWANAQQEKEDE